MSAPLLFDFDQQLLASTLTPNSPKKQPVAKEPERQQLHHPQHQQYHGQQFMCPEYDYSSLMAPPDYQDGMFKQPQQPMFNPLSNTMSSQHPAQYSYSPMMDLSQGYATPAMTFSASQSSCGTEALSPEFMSPDPGLLLPADQFSTTPSPTNWSAMSQYIYSSPGETAPQHSGSGSSYRGSTDEFMQSAMGINLAGLGLATSPDPTMTGYATPQQSVHNSPVTPLKSPAKMHTIARETRKGQDLGLALEDFEMLETLGQS